MTKISYQQLLQIEICCTDPTNTHTMDACELTEQTVGVALTYEGRDEPVELLLVLPQLHQQQATQRQVEHGVALQLKASVQEREMLRLMKAQG